MSVSTAILLATGYDQPPEYTETAGLWKIKDQLESRYDSRKVVPILAVREWKANAEADARECVRRGVNRIVTVNYSYGAGKYLLDFAETLKAMGRSIDLACLIDPVVYYPLTRPVSKWLQAMFPTDSPFPLPDNVRAFALWRTENYRNALSTPYGRAVQSETAKRMGCTVFVPKDQACMDGCRLIVDPTVDHSSIEDDPRVHAGVLQVIEYAMAGREAA